LIGGLPGSERSFRMPALRRRSANRYTREIIGEGERSIGLRMSLNSGRRAPSVSEIAATNLFLRKISTMPSLESARASRWEAAQATAVGRPSDFLEGGPHALSISVLTVSESHRAHQPARCEVEVTSFDTSKHAHRLDLQAKEHSGRVGKASRENHKHFIDFKVIPIIKPGMDPHEFQR